ncbi:MAG: N-acetyl-gamma-glutamyl-phosphate reductase [Kiritimatiellia bacterium]
MIKAKIIGAGGYGGMGLVELLSSHPEAEISALVDVENIGADINDLYPHLKPFVSKTIISADDPAAAAPADVVFTATPDGVGMTVAPDEIKKGAKLIDFSGDFRFDSPESYAEYAGRLGRKPDHASPQLLPESVYGLTELHRDVIGKSPSVVGNPGCFAVSCILGLAPAAANGLIDPGTIICDCKTGVSGAGKKPNAVFHYPARYDNMNAYKLAGHQHICEIERELGLLAGRTIRITFTAQVVPVCRGIMSSLYAGLEKDISARDAVQCFRDFYSDSEFVRVFDKETAGSTDVRGTNYCNLVVTAETDTSTLRVISYIDNLMKGQAGSAVQNMNLLCGLPETAGLGKSGMYP